MSLRAIGLVFACLLANCSEMALERPPKPGVPAGMIARTRPEKARTGQVLATIRPKQATVSARVASGHGGAVPADSARLAIARIFVAEAGWDSEPDHRAIFGVLRNIRGRGSMLEAARRASPRTTGIRGPLGPRGLWIATLIDSDLRPAGWTDRLGSWSAYVARWRSVRELAARLLAGDPIRSGCPDAIAWGMAQDDRIAIRRGLVRVDCGQTLNRFWRSP